MLGLRLRKEFLELIKNNRIDVIVSGVFPQKRGEGMVLYQCLDSGFICVGGGHPQLLERITEHGQGLLRGAHHGPAQRLVAFSVVGFEGGQQSGLCEGGFATATCTRHKEQDPLSTRGHQLCKSIVDVCVTSGVAVSFSVGKRRQTKVGVGEALHIVGNITVVMLVAKVLLHLFLRVIYKPL